MLSSITNKFKSLISGLSSEQETVSLKRKNPFDESPSEDRDSDIEVVAVKRGKFVEPEANSVFSSIKSMSDWVQGKNLFSWRSDKTKAVASGNGVKNKKDGANGTHHRFATVNNSAAYMSGSWPVKDSRQSLPIPSMNREYRSRTVQTEEDAGVLRSIPQTKKPLFLMSKQPQFSAYESVRLEDKMRYKQLLQKFTTVPLQRAPEESEQKIRNPVRAPQLPRFFFNSNDSILGTKSQADRQPAPERPRDISHEQSRLKVKSLVRSTPKTVHTLGRTGEDTSMLITDLSAITTVPGDSRPLHTIDLTDDNTTLAKNERLSDTIIISPEESQKVQEIFGHGKQTQDHLGQVHVKRRVTEQPYNKPWPNPTKNLYQNGYGLSEEDNRLLPADKDIFHNIQSSSKTVDLTEDDDVQIVKIEKSRQSKRKDFRDSELQSDDWIKELSSTYSRKARERDRQIAELEMQARIHEERNTYDAYELEQKIRDQLQVQRKEPVFVEDLPEEPVVIEEEEEEEVSLPELTAEMSRKIDYCLGSGNPAEVLADKFRLQITRGDMSTLNGLNWLNDEIINFYMNLLMERGEKEGNAKVYAFNTFFYPKVMSGGQSAVKRWTRRVDVLGVDYILIPVHLQMHWCLAVINFKKKEIQYYDSMGGRNNECLNALRKYLCDESLDKKKKEFDLSGWQSITVKDIPQQMNGSDCGMFACKYAEYITRGAPITFTQKDMPYFRRRMVYEIHTCKLLQ